MEVTMRDDETGMSAPEAFILGLALGLLLLGTVFLNLKSEGYSLVTCPTEDSCRADYDGDAGAWRIIPVVP